MIRTILRYPDPRLRIKADQVTNITTDTLRLIDDMAETMYASNGVGLAATQIGEPLRIFIVDIAARGAPRMLRAYINPRIVAISGESNAREGCLSFPGVADFVRRPDFVHVSAMSREGVVFEIAARGFEARAVLHEMDHLDGIVMSDYWSAAKRKLSLKRLR